MFAIAVPGDYSPCAAARTCGDSESCLQARVEGARTRRTDRTWIGELCAAVGKIGNGAGIEECSVGRIAVVEDIVRTRVDLECLVDLIGCMQVENCIGRQPLRLIGFVADKILTADEQRISPNLECVSQRIFDPCLDPVAGDCRDSIAGQNLDIAVERQRDCWSRPAGRPEIARPRGHSWRIAEVHST